MQSIDDLENSLETLRNGQLTGFSSPAGWLLAVDAMNIMAAEQLMDIYRKRYSDSDFDHFPVVLLADERTFLKYISAIDLAVFDWMAGKTGQLAVWFDGIIGISEELRTGMGEVSFALAKDDYAIHLVKRLRNPVAVIPAHKELVSEYAQYCSSYSCTIHQEGFTRLYPFK